MVTDNEVATAGRRHDERISALPSAAPDDAVRDKEVTGRDSMAAGICA